MESLYRKYRPQTFADVVGQQHVVGTLERAVLEGRTSHAYLFCGPRGTGKTTMARLLAKALMCEQGPAQLPDGTCEQCQLIAAGEHPDVYELDAASRTGVDSVREEIINSVSYAPTHGRYKVYIIDEVHMLTTAAFNALLKTLEEPPSHVVFVLCTTDPQKIPATILSRVQRFDFRPIGNADIQKHLAQVCEQEGFTYEEAALELITVNARGGMRDALSTLEQLSVFGSGVITLDAARDLLGAVSGMALEGVVSALASRDIASLFTQVGELVNSGRDLLQFTRELAACLRDVYVVKVVGANPAVLPSASNVAQLQAYATAFGSADRLARVLTLLGDVSREMATAPNQRLVLEIAFTRMARPESDLTLESLAERVAELEQRLANATVAPSTSVVAQEKGSVSAAASPVHGAPQAAKTAPAQQPAPVQQPVPAQRSVPAQQPAANRSSLNQTRPNQVPRQPNPVPSQSAPTPVPGVSNHATPTPAAQPAQKASAPAPSQGRQAMDPGALQRSWRQVVSELVARIPARGTLLSNAVATSDDGHELVVSLPKGSAFALKMLERPDIRTAVEGVVTQVFGPRVLVFKEGTTTDLQIPRGRQNQRRPSAERQEQVANPVVAANPQQMTAQETAPSAQPQARPEQRQARPASNSSRPQRTSAPLQQPEPTPPANTGYPMPWDVPPAEEPYYEAVPYEELGGFSEDDAFGYEQDYASATLPDPAPTSASARATAPAPTASSTSAATPPVTSPEASNGAGFSSRTLSAPVTGPSSKPASSSEPKPATAAGAPQKPDEEVRQVPNDLPPELVTILQNAFEVFGSDVRVSRDG